MHFHKDGYHSDEEGEGNCISAGDSDLEGHEYWIIGNVFYDDAHVALVKDHSYGYFLNNTVVNVDKAAIYFEVPGDSKGPGRGAYIDGTIFYNAPTVFEQVVTSTELVINRSIVTSQWLSYGVGNTCEDPRLVNPAGGDFFLGPGSPGLATGPNGIDMGAKAALGASISGEPPALTRATSAVLTVAGPGVITYKYRLNGGAWSAEAPVAAPITLAGLADGVYSVDVLGKNVAGVWQTTAATSKSWAVNTALRRVQINEVLAINSTAVDHEGTYPDLVELVNSGAVSVDLSGMAISDKESNATKYVFPAGTVLGVGEYLVLFADAAGTATSGLHLGFKLDGDQGAIYLFDTVANGSTLLDSVVYGKQIADLSIGRVGHDAAWALTQPTFSTANIAVRMGDPARLRINEWFTDGDMRLTNDFIELYNTDFLPVALAGLSLTDNPVTQPGKYVLPALSFAPALGCVSYTADGDTEQGSSHLSFQLSSGKEWIGLFDADLDAIDKVVHYGQTIDLSQGRSPDGGPSPYAFYAVPTPGVANTVNSTITDLVAGLRITEIMYNPSADADLEFIEFLNVGTATLNLAGVRLGGAISFTFPAALLAPGQYAVVCRNMAKFSEYYGPGINLLGEYSDKLSDGGDSIVLQLASPYETAILRFDFNDAWYPTTDGDGYSLVIVDPAASADRWDQQASWHAGAVLGGTPGRADGGSILAGIVINEVLTHTDEPLADAIELYNTTDAAIDISGWYLSDEGGTLLKFRIPDGTVLAAHSYVVFYQGHWVNHVLVSGDGEFGGVGATSFALNAYQGDRLWLTAADASGTILYVADYVDFPAMANGETLGRWPNATGNLYPMESRTLGADNAFGANGPRVGPVVVSEIMYSPTALTAAETAAGFGSADEMEYIEIYNSTGDAIELAHWHLAKAVSFDFTAGTWLAAHGTLLIVSFDPASAAMLQAFRDRYGIGAAVTIVGPFSGHLSDSGEKLLLQDSDTPPLEAPDYWPPLLEDEAIYSSAWGADNDGLSLARSAADSWGPSASSWNAATPAPGAFSAAILSGSVLPVSPAVRNSAVAQVQILFNVPVTGFDLGDLRLTCNGGGNLLTAAQTLTTTDNASWTLGNLSGLTAQAGTYLLTLVAAGSEIHDAQSNALAADSNTAWTLDTQPPTALVGAVTPNPRNAAVAEIQIVFSEPVTGLDLADLLLTCDGGANLLGSSQSLATTDFLTWTLGNLSAITTGPGAYVLSLVATSSGIADAAGNALAADAIAAWLTDTSAPSAQIVAVTPNPRNSTLSQVQIVFTEVVAGLELADLRLTLDGGVNLLTGSQTLTTSDQITWTLSGLAPVTASSGVYTLTLVASASGIHDLAGNLLATDASTSWTIDLVAPTATITPVNPNPHETAVDQLTILFNEPTQGLTLANLSLTFDGGANLLTSSQTLTTADNITWTLGNLAELTATQGSYNLALSATGITDTAGNPLAAAASTSWALFLASLDADGNGTADALTDGILILRYLFDSNGSWNFNDALGSGATRTTRSAIKTFLDRGATTALDADGNGTADALTDGILILRYLFDAGGSWNFNDALGSGATRTTRPAIRAYLDRYNPALAGGGLAETLAVEELVQPSAFSAEPSVLATTESITESSTELTVAITAPAADETTDASLALATVEPAVATESPQFAAETAEPQAVDAILRQWTGNDETFTPPTLHGLSLRASHHATDAADDLFGEDDSDWQLLLPIPHQRVYR
jgi:hypothetical protein